MVRIAVYDDNEFRRDSLAAFINLSTGFQFAGSFENCTNIIKDMDLVAPDLVLMDIEMPGIDGIGGVRLIKQHYPHIKVIMQTAFDDDDRVFAAIQAGAEGYILKSASINQISQSIDEVINGGASMSPSIALKVMRYFSKEQTPSYNLTTRENEVLKKLTQGLSYKMIADELGVSYFTVNNHVKKIYDKLQVHSFAEAVALFNKTRLV